MIITRNQSGKKERGIVYGVGREMRGGSMQHYLGEEVEVTLIAPLTPKSQNWYVQFDGEKEIRIRKLLRKIE